MSNAATSFTRNMVATGSGDYEALVLPNDAAHVGRRGVIFCHGFTASGRNGIDWANSPGLAQIMRKLAILGVAVVTPDLGGDTFGNDLAMTRIGQARTYLAAQGCKNDKVLFVADSMGNWAACRYAMDNPGQVAAILALEPGIDLNGIRDGNVLGTQAAINTAWSLTAGSTSATVPLPTRADLMTRAAAGGLAGLRYRAYYSTGDAVISQSSVTTLIGNIGSSADTKTVAGAPAHGFGLTNAVPYVEAATWLATAA